MRCNFIGLEKCILHNYEKMWLIQFDSLKVCFIGFFPECPIWQSSQSTVKNVVALNWLHSIGCIQLVAFNWLHPIGCLHLVIFNWLHSNSEFQFQLQMSIPNVNSKCQFQIPIPIPIPNTNSKYQFQIPNSKFKF